jgi:hypothetical protein
VDQNLEPLKDLIEAIQAQEDVKDSFIFRLPFLQGIVKILTLAYAFLTQNQILLT